MKIYGLRNCDSCRKARKMLEDKGFNPEFVDVRKDGIGRTELARFFKEFSESLINTRSTTWRGLTDAEKVCNPLELLLKYPTLMKRPIVESNGKATLGWTKTAQDTWL